MPYYYRGKMLAHLPPLIWVLEPDDGNLHARLPLARGCRPSEDDYIKKLNEYYYSLLEMVSWETYDKDIPFIGAAVLARAKGNLRAAFSIALELRSDGTLSRAFSVLQEAARRHNRPEFELLLEGYKSQLEGAARHLGVRLENLKAKSFYRLVTSWLPKGVEGVIEAAVQLLPLSVQSWGRREASRLLTKSSLQLLFVEHVRAIQADN